MSAKIFAVFLGLLGTSYTLASYDLNYELYKIDPKTYYAIHPASDVNNPAEGFAEKLPLDLVPHICTFMDLTSSVSFFSCCHVFYTTRDEVLFAIIPQFYKHLGLDYDDVFLKLDHPRWLPWKLPHDIAVKLHYQWFGKANSLMKKENPSDEDILTSYRLFYSAGCLGHMLAAEKAGAMLLRKDLSKIIPDSTPYESLEPEAKDYDIRRLNEEPSSQKELAQIARKLEYLLEKYEDHRLPRNLDRDEDDNSESDSAGPERNGQNKNRIGDDHSESDSAIPESGELNPFDESDASESPDISILIQEVDGYLKALTKLEPTQEVMVYQSFLNQYLDHLKSTGSPMSFDATEIYAMAGSCKESTFLLDFLRDETLDYFDTKGCRLNHIGSWEWTVARVVPAQHWYEKHLSFETLRQYAYWFSCANEREMLTGDHLMKKYLNLVIASMLLGTEDLLEMERMPIWSFKTGIEIFTFLLNLIVTRNPNAERNYDVENNLQYKLEQNKM